MLRYYSIIIYQETICSLVSARKQILLDSKIKTIIKEAIQTTGHHPFLFVGSGLSKRHLGSEKWDELLIGVKDNGNISGIKSEEEYYMIEAASQMYTKPQVDFTATRWNVQGKCVLEIYIAPGNNRPYLAPDKDGKFKAYIRVADENILANDVLIQAWQKSQSAQGTLLKLNKPVKLLFAYLEQQSVISLSQFSRKAHIKLFTAKQILSDLISMHILEYTVIDKQILYRIRDGYVFDNKDFAQ